MRDLPAVPADLTPRRLLHPADNTREDPEAAASGAGAAQTAMSTSCRASVVPGCYGAVLTPYNKVRVDAGATPYSGDYLITKVVHRITPSLYSQELEAKTDSVTEVSARAGRRGARAAACRSSVPPAWGCSDGRSDRNTTVERLVERVGSSYFGKYRGIVTDVDDPENPCRIRATRAGGARRAPLRLGACRRRRSPATATAW